MGPLPVVTPAVLRSAPAAENLLPLSMSSSEVVMRKKSAYAKLPNMASMDEAVSTMPMLLW